MQRGFGLSAIQLQAGGEEDGAPVDSDVTRVGCLTRICRQIVVFMHTVSVVKLTRSNQGQQLLTVADALLFR